MTVTQPAYISKTKAFKRSTCGRKAGKNARVAKVDIDLPQGREDTLEFRCSGLAKRCWPSARAPSAWRETLREAKLLSPAEARAQATLFGS